MAVLRVEVRDVRVVRRDLICERRDVVDVVRVVVWEDRLVRVEGSRDVAGWWELVRLGVGREGEGGLGGGKGEVTWMVW